MQMMRVHVWQLLAACWASMRIAHVTHTRHTTHTHQVLADAEIAEKYRELGGLQALLQVISRIKGNRCVGIHAWTTQAQHDVTAHVTRVLIGAHEFTA